MSNFGTIRSLSEQTINDPSMIIKVMAYAMQGEAHERQQAVDYVTAKLRNVTGEHDVSLSEIVSFLSDGYDALKSHLSENGYHMSDELIAQFIAALAHNVAVRPNRAAFVFVTSEKNSAVYLSGYEGNSFCVRLGEKSSTGETLDVLDYTMGSEEPSFTV